MAFEGLSESLRNPLLKQGVFGEILGRVFEVFVSVEELKVIAFGVLYCVVDFIEDLVEGVVDFVDSVRVLDHFLDYDRTPG